MSAVRVCGSLREGGAAAAVCKIDISLKKQNRVELYGNFANYTRYPAPRTSRRRESRRVAQNYTKSGSHTPRAHRSARSHRTCGSRLSMVVCGATASKLACLLCLGPPTRFELLVCLAGMRWYIHHSPVGSVLKASCTALYHMRAALVRMTMPCERRASARARQRPQLAGHAHRQLSDESKGTSLIGGPQRCMITRSGSSP